MSSGQWGQVNVTSSGAALLVQQGSGAVLLNNTDQNNTVWLGDDPFELAPGDSSNASPLPPLGFASFDGSAPVYGITNAGASALVSRYPGGGSFFQLVELLVKTLIISGTAGNGLYDYSPGSPGLGNLVASISNQTVDPFGNLTVPGISAYGGTSVGTLGNGGLAVQNNGHLVGSLGADVIDQLFILAGAFFPLVIENAVALDPVAGNIAEAWHTLPLAAGWSTAAGQPVPSYRLLPDGTVQLVGVATHAAFNATTALSTAGALPAPYRPLTTQFVSGNTAGDAIGSVSTAGTVSASIGNLASATAVRFNGVYPVNL